LILDLFAESITIALGFGLNCLRAAQYGDDAAAIGEFRGFRAAAQTAGECLQGASRHCRVARMTLAENLSPIGDKKRARITKAGLRDRRQALYDICCEFQPASVRQVFYQATVRGLIPKLEVGYQKIKTDLVDMRRAGMLPYEWLVDYTRWQRRPTTFDNIDTALRITSEAYRKSLWSECDVYVEIWLEKDALSGVIFPITEQFDVPLMVARGYASESFLYSAGKAVKHMAARGKRCFVYHLGDFDPSGQDAARVIEKRLRDHSGGVDLTFERVAVTPQQIEEWSLPTRPTKQSDTRAKKFGPVSVELDAIDPNRLRLIVQGCIERHLPPEKYSVLMKAEKSEQELFRGLAGC
jgi:hypothetical protein